MFLESRHVRFGSKADMCSAQADVRFTPKSGHVQCTSVCPLCAKSGHWSLFRQGSFPQAFLKSREVFRSTKRSPFLDVANAQRGIELA